MEYYASMNSRQRIEAALTFQAPDRIPLQVHPSPAGLHEHGEKLLQLMQECGSDFGDTRLFTLPENPSPADFDPDGRYHAIRTDGWGTTWEYRIFGIWGHPIDWPLNDWSRLDGYRAPEVPSIDGPRNAAIREAARVHRREWYLIEDAGALFETLRWVRRFESVLMDLEDDTPEINRLADIVCCYDEALIRRACALKADAVSFGDDLGTANALMTSPEVFRRFFKPRYERVFAPALRAGCRLFFHSCGQISAVLEDLKDVGAAALWPQLPLFDLPELARQCRDLGIALILHPDRGELMQRGTPEEIRAAVLRLLDIFDTAHGGSWLYVEIDPGFPWRNVEALFRVAMEVRRG
jgi:hypothetical protein